jgi:hypothetical protein
MKVHDNDNLDEDFGSVYGRPDYKVLIPKQKAGTKLYVRAKDKN